MKPDGDYWRIFRANWQRMTPVQKAECIREHKNEDADTVNWWLVHYAREEQIPPTGDWRIWLLLAGRGFGKTRTINEWANFRAWDMSGSRGAVVAATAADARDVLIEGESGLLYVGQESNRPTYIASKRRLIWPNGSQAIVLSADEPARFRGPQYHWAIADELAAWRYPEAWDMLMFGLRLGDDPRCAVATTPRPTDVIKDLVKDPMCVITKGTTYDNRPNLAPAFFSQIIRKYEGTRLGRQELNAEILDDNPGALWKRAWIDATRTNDPPDLTRVVVAVDPSGTTGGDEIGITVQGAALIGGDWHFYVLDDASLHGTPNEWGNAVVAAYHKWKADAVIAEGNFGGEMVTNTIQTVEGGKNVNVKLVHASRGKAVRAEPVSAVYEQGRGHHVGTFPALEDELCQWEPGMASPNRFDALVWGGTELIINAAPPAAGATVEYDDLSHYKAERHSIWRN